MMAQCPRGCDAFLEYVGVDDGFGMHGQLCCDIWQCPACGETVADGCQNCEDDEVFGDHEHQLEERAKNNAEEFGSYYDPPTDEQVSNAIDAANWSFGDSPASDYGDDV